MDTQHLDHDATDETVPAAGPPAAAGRMPFADLDLPATGDLGVDTVLAGLSGLVGSPVDEHVAVYDRVHRELRDCLADLEPAGTLRP